MTLQILESGEGQSRSAETGIEEAEKPLVPGCPRHQHLCLKLMKALELGTILASPFLSMYLMQLCYQKWSSAFVFFPLKI